ncbi:unnamed protein product [Rotaria socialis]|uniref:Uncharacterized protein n=1 Tax=Rotaria socialis TaxID=392032 RepID=A0A818NAZ8_9BILA|nr:unnamed protein product [Rotaria socialis]
MQGKNQMHQRFGNLRQAQSLDNIPRSFDSFYCDVNEKYHSDSRRRQSRRDENGAVHGSHRAAECRCSPIAKQQQLLYGSGFTKSMNWPQMSRSISSFGQNSVRSNFYHQHAKEGFVYWPTDILKDNHRKKPKVNDSRLYLHRNYASLYIQ